MPNRLPRSRRADDHSHSNRNPERNKEHVVRDRLHFDPGHMSDGMLPTILPNWTIKRADQDARDRGEYRQVSTVTKTPLEANRVGAIVPYTRFGIEMITAAEYRAWAEESLECARTAATESSREAYIKFAEVWFESALRAERLAALLERPSKELIPTTDYEWVLPPFQEWRRIGTSAK